MLCALYLLFLWFRLETLFAVCVHVVLVKAVKPRL